MNSSLLILLESDPARCAALAERFRERLPSGIEVVLSGAEAETLRLGHPGEDVLIAEMRPHPDSPVLPVAARGVVTLLADLLQSARPAVHAHTDATLRLTELLAADFEIPEEFREEFRQATRLHAVAFLGQAAATPTPAVTASVFRSSAMQLRHVEGFTRIAELIEGAGANWDGSGQPQFQRGEIPFRSRLLRLAADVTTQAARHGPGIEGTLAALDALAHRSGTWYDPAVMARLRVALVAEAASATAGGTTVDRVGVDQLREGMRLASDVTCDSGMTLLRGGQVLTPHVLDLLRARHLTDPIVGSILVHRTPTSEETR
jgi:hypothetical protein